MYDVLLVLHSLVRWFVIVAAVAAVAHSASGWLGRKDWTATSAKLGRWFMIGMDVQLLVGGALYFVSPTVATARADVGAAMGDPALRFWGVEHLALMLIALFLVHIGLVAVRRVDDPVAKHRRAALILGLALIAIIVAIPWPFRAELARPWLRLGIG